MKKRNLLVILLLFFSHYTFAHQPTDAELHQNSALCSYGYNSNCGTGSNNGGNNSYYSSDYYAAWNVDRYGAVTIGEFRDGTWQYFSITDKRSEKKAKENVLTQCKQSGAKSCTTPVTYSNQCMNAAQGTKGQSITIYYGVGKFSGLADDNALENCKNNNAEQCKLFRKADCSFARPPIDNDD